MYHNFTIQKLVCPKKKIYIRKCRPQSFKSMNFFSKN
nr:hypothetical protein [Borreliella garinii]